MGLGKQLEVTEKVNGVEDGPVELSLKQWNMAGPLLK